MKPKFLLLTSFLFIILVPISSAQIINGDINNDGGVTSVDALIALKMAVGKINEDPAADMDGDGRVTSLDAYKILLLSLGKEDDLFLQLSRVVKNYDVGKYLTDERMNWFITKDNGAVITIGVIIEKGKLVTFQQGPIKDPTINVYTSERIVNHLLETMNPEEFKQAIKNGDIKLEGVGFFNWIRISITSFFI